ncbi:MAG TPA: hypothetical protein VGI63_09685 [Verrucomicrobiae bacterium]
MKTAAAIICGFVLALAQLFAAQPALCAAPTSVRACCHCGGKMACCAEQPSSRAPASATVVRTAPQNEISFLPQAISLLVPQIVKPASVSAVVALVKPAAAPIYARDCARLI